ncbi:hypothetical protein BASA83_006651 [Batrachochytrium salamandrivorans]|nr:hypothetical protein BASA83_006651 [Batrachochytrium salamandrivorans]
MQFFYLFSFVVAASYAVALPQPAELSEKHSNNVDATLASGLEARSYQPGLNSYKESATLMSLERRDDSEESSGEDSESDSSPPPNTTPTKPFNDPFTKDAVSSENLASTIKNVGDGNVDIFEGGELAGKAIEDLVGDMLAKYLRRNAYVNVALGRWEHESVNDILGLIKSNFSEDERPEEELKLTKKMETYSDGVHTRVNALLYATSNIAEDVGSIIENVKKTRRSFKAIFESRGALLGALMSKLRLFEDGTTLLGQLGDVVTNLDEFLAEQKKLYVSLVDIIQRRQNAGLNTHVLFIDIRKAFDTVPVGALLWKLQNMGFPRRTLAFLKALDNVICSLISSTIDQNQMHLVSDAHGYPMFAKACWESIKAVYTSASITDGMDLYRDLNQVFYDPSLGVAELLDQMDLLRRKLAVAAVTLPIQFGRTIIKDQTSKAMEAIPIGPSGDLKHFCTNCNRTVSHQTNDCCNKPQFSYSSNISQLHSTYDSVFITQHTPTIKTKDTEKDMAFMAIANSDDLISDSGATAHMTCRKEWLSDYTPISHYSVSTATKEPHIVEGKGTLRLLSYHDGKAVPISITNVLYVPNYAVNLISECCLEEKGCTIESSKMVV